MFTSQMIQLGCQIIGSAIIASHSPLQQVTTPACAAMYSPQVVESTYNYYDYMYRW